MPRFRPRASKSTTNQPFRVYPCFTEFHSRWQHTHNGFNHIMQCSTQRPPPPAPRPSPPQFARIPLLLSRVRHQQPRLDRRPPTNRTPSRPTRPPVQPGNLQRIAAATRYHDPHRQGHGRRLRPQNPPRPPPLLPRSLPGLIQPDWSILQNPTIRHLWPIWHLVSFAAESTSFSPVLGRFSTRRGLFIATFSHNEPNSLFTQQPQHESYPHF